MPNDLWSAQRAHAGSGSKYIVPASKHQEGFCLWPSAETNKAWGRAWNAMDTGPKRDLMAELREAVEKRGVKVGFYYSLYEWFNPLWLKAKCHALSVSEEREIIAAGIATDVNIPPQYQ